MSFLWSRPLRTACALIGLAALSSTLSGCGGNKPSVDEAVTLPDPSVRAGSSASTGASTTPVSAPTTAATTPDTGKSSSPTTPGKAGGWGTLKGKVTFDGGAPDQPLIVIDKDKEVCGKVPVKSEKLVVDPASKGVKFVLVYLSKPTAVNPEAKSAMATKTIVFDQKGCVFEPHVMAAMVGQTVTVKSSDPVSHNVNSKVENNVLNQAVAPNTSTPFKLIAAARQPGLVVCDIHNWMTAFWLVLDHPYFAVTNDKGEFEIKNVPSGTQKVVVWQEGARFVTPASGKVVDIAPDAVTTEDFKIAAAQIK